MVAAVVLLSFTAQVGSIHLLHRKKGFTARLNRTIQERPEKVVVTNVPWAPQEMYSVFFDKSMFYIDSQEELEALADKLRNLGLDTFLFVSRPRRNMVAVAEVPDDDLRYYSVAFSLVRLSGDPITP